MTNTFGLTDYDVYDDGDYDSYRRSRRKIRRQRRKARRIARRAPKSRVKIAPRRKILRRPPVVKDRPRPIRKKKVVRKKLPSKVPVSILIPKGTPIKTKLSSKPIFKPTLVKKGKPISKDQKVTKAQIASLQVPATVEKAAAEKAMKSDGKTAKVVKIIAIVGVTGAVGFGIYKYIQIKKKSNGHTGANKGK